MTQSKPLPDHLERLGNALHAATADDLASAHPATADDLLSSPTPAERPTTRSRRRPARQRRRIAIGALAAAVLIPSGAVAASMLISTDQVERSLPQGVFALLDTHPTCTVVREGIEFDCTLDRAPRGDVGAGNWKGTVEPTVDDTKQINGGCRSLNAAGTHWRCYVGKEAVAQQIIDAGLLGERSNGPSVG